MPQNIQARSRVSPEIPHCAITRDESISINSKTRVAQKSKTKVFPVKAREAALDNKMRQASIYE
jgi:hypothetical protein